MQEGIHQGDILKVEKIKPPVLVVSKDFFNRTGEIIGCPIYEHGLEGPLHIPIETKETSGLVQCEKLVLFDLNVRRYRRIDRVPLANMIDIADTIQGIFDYI